MHAYFWERVATSSDEEHGPLADHDAVVGLELAEEVPDRGLVVRRPGRRRDRERRGEERLEGDLARRLAASWPAAAGSARPWRRGAASPSRARRACGPGARPPLAACAPPRPRARPCASRPPRAARPGPLPGSPRPWPRYCASTLFSEPFSTYLTA